LELFQVGVVIANVDIPRLVALMLGVNKLLAMAKDTNGFRLIAMGELFFRFISRSIVLQFWGPFQEHLSPHQFGVSTLGGCEAIPFGIQTLINLHLD
jgi:hypothetical protein